ncbi:MAG TPA: lipopolysaccharide biosynthesis protein [Flavisolibacter sp.]|nr:lipopolysaccharide biosynthesis protein [Flavisolibacter sp.]
MSTIRKQSIISSIVVYLGFALGLFNTYLFTRQGGFTEGQYGLTNTFIAFANIMFSVASLGMPAYISKFFPYYQAHENKTSNDQITWALLISCIGFLVVVLLGLAFKNHLVDRIFGNAPELPRYYYWTFPFGFGYTLFMVLEAYAWQQRESIASNLLKEVVFRFFVTVLIVLTTLNFIHDFNTFIAIYSFLYLIVAITLVVYFSKKGQLHFTISVSRVTKRFLRKIKALVLFVWGGGLVFNVASVFDGIVIAAVLPNGMAAAGVFYLAQNISSLMTAPQRAVISASVGPLSKAWKEKDYAKIRLIYHRSSINQLIFASTLFCLIWLNFQDGITTFHLRESYRQAQWVFFFIGLTKIIDMGTGVNAQVIATSTLWRFELYSGLILLALALPLNYILTRHLGIIGPAISNLIAFALYNLIRCLFLWNKFKMQPFDIRSLFTICLAFACYLVVYWCFDPYQGFAWMVVRSLSFLIIFAAGMFILRLSPDVLQVWNTLKNRLKPG